MINNCHNKPDLNLLNLPWQLCQWTWTTTLLNPSSTASKNTWNILMTCQHKQNPWKHFQDQYPKRCATVILFDISEQATNWKFNQFLWLILLDFLPDPLLIAIIRGSHDLLRRLDLVLTPAQWLTRTSACWPYNTCCVCITSPWNWSNRHTRSWQVNMFHNRF